MEFAVFLIKSIFGSTDLIAFIYSVSGKSKAGAPVDDGEPGGKALGVPGVGIFCKPNGNC